MIDIDPQKFIEDYQTRRALLLLQAQDLEKKLTQTMTAITKCEGAMDAFHELMNAQEDES